MKKIICLNIIILSVMIMAKSQNPNNYINSDFYSLAQSSYGIFRYELDSVISKAVYENAIRKRTYPMMNHCVIIFDDETDVLGNEIFRVDMAVNPFSIYRLNQYYGFLYIGNVAVLLKDTANKRHARKEENRKYGERWRVDANGIYEIRDDRHETFYFVIKGDTIEPFSKVKMVRVEPVLNRPYTGKAGPIINTGSPKQHKKPWYRR